VVAEAIAEFEARRWAEARALFRRAHALSPNARTLRGIAMTSFELAEYAQCLRAADEALAHPVQPLDEAQRAHVQSLRARAEAFVARYELAIDAPDATVRLDEIVAELDGVSDAGEGRTGTITVDLGRHVLRVTAPGRDAWERRVHVAGGERERIVVSLAPLAPAAGDRSAPPPSTSASRDLTPAVATLVAGGATLALGGAAIGYWVDRDATLGRCASAICRNEDALRAERDAGAGAAIALFVTGAALTTAGVVLAIDAPGDVPSSSALLCAPAAGGVVCAGRF